MRGRIVKTRLAADERASIVHTDNNGTLLRAILHVVAPTMRPTRKGPGKKTKEPRLRREDSQLRTMRRNGNETLGRVRQAGQIAPAALRPTAAPDANGQSGGAAKVFYRLTSSSSDALEEIDACSASPASRTLESS
ncbi:hypothetical protein MRX96_024420 [Rhipicephalus microplus]